MKFLITFPFGLTETSSARPSYDTDETWNVRPAPASRNTATYGPSQTAQLGATHHFSSGTDMRRTGEFFALFRSDLCCSSVVLEFLTSVGTHGDAVLSRGEYQYGAGGRNSERSAGASIDGSREMDTAYVVPS
uniref:Uncharacterized protein n=1 Tax=Pseudictyota dubia TaxID=2749911 RepID=A0A7R9WB89_9STRA|mmetsp:Transcript_42433/g.78480  ORF Transcript_42433/g.78480 Transcript_42433/m.78480 type:complete len:133 (+) Transcript_42433:1362-1760(+)